MASCAKQAAVPSQWEKTPEVITKIEALMEHETAGNPITGVKWTGKTTKKIRLDLQEQYPTVHEDLLSLLLIVTAKLQS